jgi:hypothetical protein
MKAPFTINILGVEFRVVFSDKLDPPHVGECNAMKCVIKIHPGLCKAAARSVLLHEVIEAINETLGLKLMHSQICGLEAGLNSVRIQPNTCRRKSHRKTRQTRRSPYR